MAAPQLTPTELLEAVSFALNSVRNTRLHGCPHGFRDTYDLAAEVDRHIAARSEEPSAEQIRAWSHGE